MKTMSLAGLALIALLGNAASAADLPIAQPVPVYRAPTYFTGCYVGGNVGMGWSWAGVSNSTNQFGFGIGDGDLGTQQTSGLVGGVQGGCDYQVGSFVFGIQGLFDGAAMKGNTIWQANPAFRNNGDIPWFATVTGRIGITIAPAAMIYAKAGVAALHHNYSWDQFGVPLATASSTPIGWTAGIGAEWIFAGNWSLFAEYSYLGFGDRSVTFALTGPGAAVFPAATTSFPLSISENINIFIVGFNYRFGARTAYYSRPGNY